MAKTHHPAPSLAELMTHHALGAAVRTAFLRLDAAVGGEDGGVSTQELKGEFMGVVRDTFGLDSDGVQVFLRDIGLDGESDRNTILRAAAAITVLDANGLTETVRESLNARGDAAP